MNIVFLFFGFIFILLAYKMSKSISYSTAVVLSFIFLNFLWNRRGHLFTIGGTEFFWFETLGILIFIAFFFRIKKGGYGLLNSRYFFIIVIYVILEMIISIKTVSNKGISSIAFYKSNYSATLLLIYFSTFKISDYDLKKIFRYLGLYCLYTLFFIPLRFFGVLDMPVYVQEAQNWEAIRYLVNYQSLYIVIFIFSLIYLYSQKLIKLNSKKLAILLILIFTIIIIPQRTVWVIFLLLLLYLLLFHTNVQKKVFFLILLAFTVISFVFLLKGSFIESNVIDAALDPINNFQKSTGYARLLDLDATVFQVLKKKAFWLGLGIEYAPERYINSRLVRIPLHNIFFTKFYQGGFLFFLSYLILWIYPIFKLNNLKNTIISPAYTKIFQLIIISFFIMGNTTYGGIMDFLPLSLASAIIINSEKK